jgi:Ca-activated chloride channel family protein
MFRTIILIIAVFCLALNAQQEKPAGPLVELSLIVTDKNNNSLNSIRKDELRVIEDRVEQTILRINADERPADYGLVIDASGSLRQLMASALDAAKLIVLNRRPGDEIFIVRFIDAYHIDNVRNFTGDGDVLLKALESFKTGPGQSAVIDALHVAVDHVAKHRSNESRRKAIVFITDGEERGSLYKEEDLIKLLRGAGVQVFVLGLVIDLDADSGLIRRSPREKAQTLLKTVAEETGGRVFFPTDRKELADATVQIIGNLRGQFRITYQSTQDTSTKGFRKVEVKLISPNGEKRNAIVPRGYIAGPKDVPAKPSEKKS